MLPTSRAFRRLGPLLVLLALLCLAPGSARANSAHNPYRKDVVLSDTENVVSIAVYVDGPDGSFYLFKAFESEHTKDQKISFKRPEDAARFYVEVTITDGTVRASMPVACIGYDQDFRYDVKANTLKEKINYWGWLYLPLLLLSLLAAFAIPVSFTALTEFLTALPFTLMPYKYVVFINLITNPVMNIALYFLRNGGHGDLRTVALLETIVMLVEYLYYTKKYKDRPKGKLFAFSGIANALSWGLFELVQRLVY